MSGYFEGDLIRPLGHVTLYFGYVEAEVNALLGLLQASGVPNKISPVAPLGQRLQEFGNVVAGLNCSGVAEVLSLLEESKALMDRRNNLVHASIFAKGRVIPNDPTKPTFSVTPEELTALAEEAFNWKERLSVAVQMRLLPSLPQRGRDGT